MCQHGEAWHNIAFKTNFRFSEVIYEWLGVIIVANGPRFSLQRGNAAYSSKSEIVNN